MTIEFVEFEFKQDQSFSDLKEIYDLFKLCREQGEIKGDNFWLNKFPDYALRNFYFTDTDLKPNFQTAKNENSVWHFYSLIELFEENYEVEYLECYKLSENKGRITFSSYSYPYGGISGFITLIKSFGCLPTVTDDGTGIYNIKFDTDGNFELAEQNV